MRTYKVAVTALLLFGLWAAAQVGVAFAADGDQYIGTWKGTWEGAGAGGRFDLIFARGSDGKIAASVSVGTDMGDYTAKFSEVTIAGTFDAKVAAGTWSLGAKGQPGGQAIAGTWKVSKP